MTKPYINYLYFTFGCIGLLLSLVLFINLLIDPLWYFKGNTLFPENYSFNERISKTNLYLKQAHKYDCILLGSSRVTLLDAKKINRYDCFNFSFSDGNPSEFIKYSAYINQYGKPLKNLIIGLDARFFSREKFSTQVPDFINKLSRPNVFLKPYTSFSMLDFSLRTLMREPPQRRYYDASFNGQVLQHTKPYQPPECFTLSGFGRIYSTSRLHYYRDIKQLLQPQLFIGYVTPISAWELLPLLEDGEISSRIHLIYQASKQFDKFYDFSIPSNITQRTDSSYDGHHFYPEINDKIAATLNGEPPAFGLAVHEMSFIDYKQAFMQAITRFKQQLGPQKVSSPHCPRRSAAR